MRPVDHESDRLVEMGLLLEGAGEIDRAFNCLMSAESSQPAALNREHLRRLLKTSIRLLEEARISFELQSSIAQYATMGSLEAEDYELISDFLKSWGVSSGADYIRQRAISKGVTAQQNSSGKHLVFYTYPWSGTGAIAPILREILLTDFGYDTINGNSESSAAWFTTLLNSAKPLFICNHFEFDRFLPILDSSRVKFVCLIRDPRDALVSEVKTLNCDRRQQSAEPAAIQFERECAFNSITQNLSSRIENAERWLKLPENRCLKLTFEEMKKDIPETVSRIFSHLEINVSAEGVNQVCEKYSFKNVTGRSEGSNHPGERNSQNGFFYRKGVAGAWREFFDQELCKKFSENALNAVEHWGYSWE